MHKLPVTQLEPGDRLAAPVPSATGQVLIGAGIVLTQNKILMLRQRGVLLVEIEDRDADADADAFVPTPELAPEPEALDPEEIKKIVIAQSRRFGDTRQDPVMDTLFRAVITRATRGRIGQTE